MVKHKTKKVKPLTDEAGGKGTIKRPVNPENSFMKGKKNKKKMTQAQDDAYDRRHGIKEGSKADIKQDRLNGIVDKKKHKAKVVKHSVIAHKAKSKSEAKRLSATKGTKYNGKAY